MRKDAKEKGPSPEPQIGELVVFGGHRQEGEGLPREWQKKGGPG